MSSARNQWPKPVFAIRTRYRRQVASNSTGALVPQGLRKACSESNPEALDPSSLRPNYYYGTIFGGGRIMLALNQSQSTDRHEHVGFFTISVCDFFPSDVRHHYVDLLSILFLSMSFAVNLLFCQLLLEHSARERATHASVYCRGPTVLNVLSHVVIFACHTICLSSGGTG